MSPASSDGRGGWIGLGLCGECSAEEAKVALLRQLDWPGPV